MELLRTVAETHAWRQRLGEAPVGVVPTMGALHEGHLTLVRRALADGDQVLVTLFVNPLQFGPQEDFARYPRDLDSDMCMLEEVGAAALFVPDASVIYPEGFATQVEVGAPLTARLEGKARPGHFRGVTTVVTKLLLIAGATHGYFGMKDAQQLLVLTKLVRDLAIPTAIVPVPTVRDHDGLALSSRNRYLSAEERAAALAIPRGLDAAAARFDAGERDVATLRAVVRVALEGEHLLRPEYVSCADLDTLTELESVDRCGLLSVAVRVGRARLIDNRWLGLDLADLPPALRSNP